MGYLHLLTFNKQQACSLKLYAVGFGIDRVRGIEAPAVEGDLECYPIQSSNRVQGVGLGFGFRV